MAVQSTRKSMSNSRSNAQTYPQGSVGYDVLVLACCLWMQIGLYLDGWAHQQPGLVDTFFTPWHLVLYSGFLSVAAAIGVYQLYNMWRGHGVVYALPKGYLLGLFGILIFAVGAPFDFLWHDLFGFEENVEALISPSHLFLATGGLMFLTAPLRAAYHRHQLTPLHGWKMLFPAIFATTLTFSMISFFTQFAHPLSNPRIFSLTINEPFFRDLNGLLSTIWPTFLMMSFILLLLRTWKLPVGSITMFLSSGYILMFFMRIRVVEQFWYMVVIAIIVGLLADVYIAYFDPSPIHPNAFRWFAFALPFIMFISIYLIMVLNQQIYWNIHMWLGISFIAGGIGLFISYLVIPTANMPIRTE